MRVSLTVIAGPHAGQVFHFIGHDTFFVGRSKNAHFRLASKDRYFSRMHFMIEVNPPQCRLIDLDSHNGTFVNGKRVSTADLHDGDNIKAGHTILRIAVEEIPHAILLPDSAVVPEPAPQLVAPEPVPRLVPPVVTVDVNALVPGGALAGTAQTCRACGSLLVTKPLDLLCPSCEGQARGQPQPVPNYRIVRELGRGGMGVVYLAVRLADGSAVALKTVKPADMTSRTTVERFLREAQILRNLQHLNIVRFYEMGQATDLLFFTMEYVRGVDARTLLKAEGPFPVERVLTLGCQLLDALEYAHGLGIVHRDIKPSNLLIAEEGGQKVVRLTDFGLARVYQLSALSGLTMAGDVGGTMAFIAPEQITNFRDAKPAADQYAAAATLYYLLTGSHIYDLPKRYEQQMLMILNDAPVSIEKRRADVPKKLAAVIHRALAREPEKRFLDVRGMRRALLLCSY